MSMMGMFAQATDEEIQGLLADPDEILVFLETREEQDVTRVLELEKNWHALHWLLTGSKWEGEPPLNFIVQGGAEIGDVDLGYGAARAFTSAEVAVIHAALGPISTVELLSRYNGQAMQDLYPDIWNRPDEEHINREDLASHFERLKQFVADLAGDRLGMIVWLE